MELAGDARVFTGRRGEHSGFFLSQLKLVGFELCAKGSNGDPGPPWM